MATSQGRQLTLQLPSCRWAPVGLLVIAASVGWLGWSQGAASRLGERVAEARVSVAAAIDRGIAAQSDTLASRLEDANVQIALAAHDLPAAATALATGWPGVEAEMHPVDLAPAFAEARDFGYARLGLLQAALADNATRVGIIRQGAERRLAMAAPVTYRGDVTALVLVRLPDALVDDPLNQALPGGAYLGLRTGRHAFRGLGDRELASLAEVDAVTLAGAPALRVVGAAPSVSGGMFDMGGVAEYAMAAIMVLLAIGLYLQEKGKLPALRKAAPEAEPEAELTMAEALARPPEEVVAAALARGRVDAPPPLLVDRTIFRAYDVRGVVGQSLDEGVAKALGQAIGTLMHQKGLREVVVGRDGRLSGPAMANALIEGLRSTGRDVIDIGLAPTPLVYYGAYALRAGSCVAVTGSHNPPDYNGFKIVVGGETLAGEAIQSLYARIVEGQLHRADAPGAYEQRDIGEEYVERIAGDIQLERPLRVVVDAGSGVAGGLGPRVLQAIGAEVEELYCEIDGTFPHHHPDPSDPHNLTDLIQAVQRVGADIGLAFDGDGDRLGVVTREGEIIYPDRLLMLFAADVLDRNPGACVIYDVKCTGHLAGHILRHGGSPLMWKTGHSLIKAKMRETEAELAGEMSGHFFFKERWYGFDDGLYAAARLLEILAARGEEPEEVFAALPKGVSTPELKIATEEGGNYALVERFRAEAKFEGARLSTIDGLRVDWPDGWGLVRASNTTPVVVLRFDADSAEALQRIQEAFREQLLALDPDLALPF
jgi:phosphomannomutase/phosphoglucomutase